MIGHGLQVYTIFQRKKHNNFEYFDQVNEFFIIYVTIFTQGKEITKNKEILIKFFL